MCDLRFMMFDVRLLCVFARFCAILTVCWSTDGQRMLNGCSTSAKQMLRFGIMLTKTGKKADEIWYFDCSLVKKNVRHGCVSDIFLLFAAAFVYRVLRQVIPQRGLRLRLQPRPRLLRLVLQLLFWLDAFRQWLLPWPR